MLGAPLYGVPKSIKGMAVKGKTGTKKAKSKPGKGKQNRTVRPIGMQIPPTLTLNAEGKEVKPLPKSDKRRSDWEMNDLLIQQCFWKFVEENMRPPHQTELAEMTGLNRATIADHYDKKTFYDITAPFKAASTNVIMGITKKAVDGNTEAAKFYRESVWGEGSKLDVRHTIDDIRASANRVDEKQSAITFNPALVGLVPDDEG